MNAVTQVHITVFATSNVLHFGAVLLAGGILSPAWQPLWLAGLLLSLAGLAGATYMFAHVRPTEFLEGFFLIFTSDSVRQPNLIRLPFGEGRTAPVIAENVARMVRHAALHSAVARWQDLSLDRSATREHALLCTRAFEDGWTITFQDIPWWDRLLESGLAVPQLNHLATVADLHRAGRYEMSDDVLALTWQRPLSMHEFVRQAQKAV